MNIHGCILTPLHIISGENGDVLHALKSTEGSFTVFGEAYFSSVKTGRVKGWKKHLRSTLNLVVPVGRIKFFLFDDRPDSPTSGQTAMVELSPKNYQRLTVMPGVWVAFQGIGDGLNLLLNITSEPHDPAEAENQKFGTPGFPVF